MKVLGLNISNQKPTKRSTSVYRPTPATRNNKVLRKSVSTIQSIDSTEALQRQFEVASGDRIFADFNGDVASINADIYNGLTTLQGQAKKLFQNDGYIKKYAEILKKYVVGPYGFVHRNKAFEYKVENNKRKKEYLTYENQLIQDAWTEYCKPEYCSIRGNRDFTDNTDLFLLSLAFTGEVFIKHIDFPKSHPFGYQFQIIPSHLCDVTLTRELDNGRRITMGVEHDETLKAYAYWFKVPNPNLEVYGGFYTDQYVRIPSEQIIHYFDQEFTGQLRGFPWVVQGMYRSHLLKGVEEATLLNLRSAARKANVLQKKESGKFNKPLTNSTVGGSSSKNGKETIIVKNIKPGESYIVPDGYEMVPYDPTFPTDTQGPFSKMILMGLAASLDVDYPTFSGDFEKVNFASSKAASLDARNGYLKKQVKISTHILIPIRKRFFRNACTINYLEFDPSKWEMLDKPVFQGYRAQWSDMLKENAADAFAVNNQLETLEKTLARRGYDLEEFIEQRKYEKELLIEAGLSIDDVLVGKPKDGKSSIEEVVARLLNIQINEENENA